MDQNLAGRVSSYARWGLGGSGQWPKEADGGVAQRGPVGDVHGPWNRTRTGRIVVRGTAEDEQGGEGAAGEDAHGTRSAKEEKEGGRKEEERLGRPRNHPLSQRHLSRGSAMRRPPSGEEREGVMGHGSQCIWRPSPP